MGLPTEKSYAVAGQEFDTAPGSGGYERYIFGDGRSEVPMRQPFHPMRSSLVAAALCSRPPLPRQEHPHSHGEMEALGKVNFPTTCRGVDAEFTRAVALLHSFGYEESRRAFEEVATKDPGLRDGVLGNRDDLVPPDLGAADAAGAGRGKRPPRRRRRSSSAKTDRERGYIAAIGAFYARLGSLEPPGPREGLQRRARADSRGSCPTTTRR